MAKVKAKNVLVIIQSLVSRHTYRVSRPRLDDKVVTWQWDPYIQQMSVYKELKKIRSIK